MNVNRFFAILMSVLGMIGYIVAIGFLVSGDVETFYKIFIVSLLISIQGKLWQIEWLIDQDCR